MGKANHIIKESSVIQTPNKTSKNRSKPMAVLNEKPTDCETKVVNKVKENKVKLSELQTKTPNKKKGRSIVVDKIEMAVSGDKVSAEETEVKGSSVMETKTPTKPSKKKRKSMAVGQGKTVVSVENVLAKAIEIPQESSVIASETPSKKKSTSIAVDRKETVSGENVSAE